MLRVIAVFLPVLFFLSLSGAVSAQTAFPPTASPKPTPSPTPAEIRQPCPNINVQPMAQTVRDGQPAAFSVNMENRNAGNQPTITWNVSVGTIIKGQYTPRIEVDTTGAGTLPEREIKAEVFITGFAPECALQASGVIKIIPAAVKFGEFGEVPAVVVTKNLKTMADVLNQSPDNLSLVIYAGRNSERNYSSMWFKRIKDELVANGIPIRKISAIDGGFREQPIFEFWLVPTGAEQPRPAPTIKREEIVYPKTVPKKP